jgi:UDP-N-acetylmuramyl tripeptide synthase
MLVHERLLYIGPNRRTERTAIEWLVELEPTEVEEVGNGLAPALAALAARIEALGLPGAVAIAATLRQTQVPDREPVAALAAVAGQFAVALQRGTGHRVGFSAVLPARLTEQRRLVYEYEHGDTGADAGEIAMRLLASELPLLRWARDDEVPGDDAFAALRLFLERAPQHVLPRDAQAIFEAAARLDIPCVKLERAPYKGLAGEFRIRPNGLLKLGHARHQRIVDGTLCLDRNVRLVPWLFDREQLFSALRGLALPLPLQDPESRLLTASRHVLRAAQRLGYPVVLKPVKRLASLPRGLERRRPALHNDQELRAELERLRPASPQVQVEKFIAGETWQVLVAGGQALCAVPLAGGEPATDALHASVLAVAERVAAALDCGLLVLAVVTPDPGRPLAEAGGAVVSLDPAPQLDRLLPEGSPWLDRAAEAFVRWLFPPGVPARIPLVAVTGTNGKTTTARLIARIARTAGRVTGLASTAGVYIDEQLREAGDLAGLGGHHLLFESREIDFGVLETARGGIAHSGFMFDHCEVGVCLNVTEDHIGEFDIDSLAAMVEIKRSILERATEGVVLNADYATCLGMLPFAPGVRVCLCSLTQPAPELLDRAGPGGAACVIERDGTAGNGAEWLVWYEDGGRLPVLAVADFPAALGGAARFNLSNAQHAVAAARLMGFEVETIARGLRSFDASFETNPGRLNVYGGHPFTVIMDYAHNPDGMEQLLDCVDRLGVTGRRILLYAGTGNRSDAEVVRHTLFPLGRVDHYVVRRYPGKLRGRGPDEIPRIMLAALREAGVPEERITIAEPPEQGAAIAMRLARPGDLVIVTPGSGEFEAMWEQVRSFAAAGSAVS